ncbi:uncharacterized protein ACRADG_006883 [Cochliomyia hominivorax]
MNISLFRDAHLQRIGAHIQAEEINILVANALKVVIQNVFANIANAFVITLSIAQGPEKFWFNDILSRLFASSAFMTVQLVVQDHNMKRIEVPGKRYCNMIMIDSFKSLQRTYIADNNKNFDNLEYYFIFLQTTDQFIPTELNLIMRYCLDNYWLHCNVMIQNAKGEVLIYTYFPFKEGNCFQTEPQLINQFKGDRFVNEVMFPDKLQNLNKCRLKLTTWEVPPFVINGSNPHYPTRKYSGFEITIMVAISREMNFTLDMEMINIDTYHLNKIPASEPLKMLQNRETNITLGYFRRTAERDKIATPSYVTYYLPLVAVILRKENSFESVGIFTFPFDKITWLLILAVYGLIVLLNTFNVRKRRVQNFQIFEVLIGMSLKILPKSSSKRIRFLTLILSSFILRTVYQSLLFHLFRTHFYKAPPVSIESLLANNYKAISTEMSFDFIRHVPQISDKSLPLILIQSSNELFPFVYIEINENENYAAISVEDFAIYYSIFILTYGHVLQILPINVNYQQICIYFVKHSYLVERFNNYILHFQQAGLLEKWKEWTLLGQQVDNKKSSTTYENALMVNLKQLTGIFIVMALLHIISLVCFVLEMLSKKCKYLKRLF